MSTINDPKMEGAKIARATSCRFGMHAFTWAIASSAGLVPHDTTLRCDCGAYDWAEWQKVVQASHKGGNDGNA